MSTYKEISFDFLADCITKKVKPQETDIAVYYGLEHLNADSIKIQRSGTPDEVIGEKIHALPGDIIFGKRRAYQRKLGVTDCECIASAHSMVLRAKPENVVPEFLPYFMQSDVFMERAVMISEGSLSPTIKWKTLAQEKFMIPDTDSQREIAELMIAFDEVIESKKNILCSLLNTKKAMFNDLENYNGDIHKCIVKKLIKKDYSGVWGKPASENEGTQILRSINFTNEGYLTYDDVARCIIPESKLEGKLLGFGDILFELSGGGPSQPVGRVVFYDRTDDEIFSYGNFVAKFVANDEIVLPKFLFYKLQSLYSNGITLLYQQATTGIRNIAYNDFMEHNTTVPKSKTFQKEFVDIMDDINTAIETAKSGINAITSHKKLAISKLLNTGGDHQ